MSASQAPIISQDKPLSLVTYFADKYGVEAKKLLNTLKMTAFKQKDKDGQPVEVSNEQMMALLVVARQYGLNPFTKEIYAYPDKGGIVPVVGVDGWSRIINTNSLCDGFEFRDSEIMADGLTGAKSCPQWMECVMYRKDRKHPTVVREYIDEVYRPPFNGSGRNGPYVVNGPWQSHTKRMFRHKVLIQCARYALGYVGIYDQDEAERILEGQAREVSSQPSIQFDSQPEANQAIEHQPKNEIMQDLAQADVSQPIEGELVQSEPLPNNMQQDVNLSQFNVSDQDCQWISQLVDMAVQNNTFNTTLENLTERYTGETLQYAQGRLNQVFQMNDASL